MRGAVLLVAQNPRICRNMGTWSKPSTRREDRQHRSGRAGSWVGQGKPRRHLAPQSASCSLDPRLARGIRHQTLGRGVAIIRLLRRGKGGRPNGRAGAGFNCISTWRRCCLLANTPLISEAIKLERPPACVSYTTLHTGASNSRKGAGELAGSPDGVSRKLFGSLVGVLVSHVRGTEAVGSALARNPFARQADANRR